VHADAILLSEQLRRLILGQGAEVVDALVAAFARLGGGAIIKVG
jgi:hypothetical protein